MKTYSFTKLHTCEWVEKEKPQIGPYDVLIEPIAASVCSSDIHNVHAGKAVLNTTLGHEGIGRIVEQGSLVKDFKVGDEVIIPAMTPDWRTIEAQMGVPQHCGGFCYGCSLGIIEDGLFAEYTRIKDADMNLALIPKGMDYKSAAMIGDMVTTGFYGAEMADIEFGDTVVIFGIGPVGLMSALASKLKGASRIIGIGSRSKCIEVGKKLGISEFIDYKNGNVVSAIRELVGKKGVDRTIVTFASPGSFNQAMSITRYGGTISNVASWVETSKFEFDAKAWGFGMGQKTIHQGLCPGGRRRMEQLIKLVEWGRIDPSVLITHEFQGMEHIPEAFKLMEDKPDDLIKTLVFY